MWHFCFRSESSELVAGNETALMCRESVPFHTYPSPGFIFQSSSSFIRHAFVLFLSPAILTYSTHLPPAPSPHQYPSITSGTAPTLPPFSSFCPPPPFLLPSPTPSPSHFLCHQSEGSQIQKGICQEPRSIFGELGMEVVKAEAANKLLCYPNSFWGTITISYPRIAPLPSFDFNVFPLLLICFAASSERFPNTTETLTPAFSKTFPSWSTQLIPPPPAIINKPQRNTSKEN